MPPIPRKESRSIPRVSRAFSNSPRRRRNGASRCRRQSLAASRDIIRSSPIRRASPKSASKTARSCIHRIVYAVDCGRPVNPNGIAAQVEGAAIYGLSAALHDAITINRGRVEQSNFNDYEMPRISETSKNRSARRPKQGRADRHRRARAAGHRAGGVQRHLRRHRQAPPPPPHPPRRPCLALPPRR